MTTAQGVGAVSAMRRNGMGPTGKPSTATFADSKGVSCRREGKQMGQGARPQRLLTALV